MLIEELCYYLRCFGLEFRSRLRVDLMRVLHFVELRELRLKVVALKGLLLLRYIMPLRFGGVKMTFSPWL